MFLYTGGLLSFNGQVVSESCKKSQLPVWAVAIKSPVSHYLEGLSTTGQSKEQGSLRNRGKLEGSGQGNITCCVLS